MKAPTIADSVARMKAEILAHIADGTVPSTVTTFSELHDYVDANEYGGFCIDEINAAIEAEFSNEHRSSVDYFNICQNEVDYWLYRGRTELATRMIEVAAA